MALFNEYLGRLEALMLRRGWLKCLAHQVENRPPFRYESPRTRKPLLWFSQLLNGRRPISSQRRLAILIFLFGISSHAVLAIGR